MPTPTPKAPRAPRATRPTARPAVARRRPAGPPDHPILEEDRRLINTVLNKQQLTGTKREQVGRAFRQELRKLRANIGTRFHLDLDTTVYPPGQTPPPTHKMKDLQDPRNLVIPVPRRPRTPRSQT